MKELLSFLGNFNVRPATPLPGSPSISKFRADRNRVISELEIRVCVNRTCRKQGSMNTLQTLSGVAPSGVSVNSCGCLGRCGAGPNLVALPDGVMVGHCATSARAAAIMMELCGVSAEGVSDAASVSLAALALRKRSQDEAQKGRLSEADQLLSQAIDLKPYGGIHYIYKERSCMRLAMGNYSEALEDAKEALAVVPHDSEAYICQGDAFLAMDQFDAAEKSYSTSLELDPFIRRSKPFKARISRLREKLATAHV